jgi:8-oxo-dGTP pyrophosphatase MutT (NUDIX family)
MSASSEHTLNKPVVSLGEFPVVQWGESMVTFHTGSFPSTEVTPPAVVVFARHDAGWIIADIPERGWCTPSGRLEAEETPLEAAIRETWEEIGAALLDPIEIGYYELTNATGKVTFFPTYVGKVDSYGDIPEGSESLGTRCVTTDELKNCYWRWDPLLERMFEYAESFC